MTGRRRTRVKESLNLGIIGEFDRNESPQVPRHRVRPDGRSDSGTDGATDVGPEREESNGESDVLMGHGRLGTDLGSYDLHHIALVVEGEFASVETHKETSSDTLSLSTTSASPSKVKESKTYRQELRHDETTDIMYALRVDQQSISDNLEAASHVVSNGSHPAGGEGGRTCNR